MSLSKMPASVSRKNEAELRGKFNVRIRSARAAQDRWNHPSSDQVSQTFNSSVELMG